MSILVKGMKMPENCAKCICADDDARFCKEAHEYIPIIGGKPTFCRLVELPDKHGRLVDVEDVKTTIRNLESYFDEHLIALLFSEIDKDKNVPTVIEAEE